MKWNIRKDETVRYNKNLDNVRSGNVPTMPLKIYNKPRNQGPCNEKSLQNMFSNKIFEFNVLLATV